MNRLKMYLIKQTIYPLGINKEMQSTSNAYFKRDPKLSAAIDKLFCNSLEEITNMLLPERKLDFTEVQTMLSQTTTKKRSENLLGETRNGRLEIMKKIEDILEKINKCADSSDKPTLTIRNQRLWTNCVYDLDRVTLKSVGDAKTTTLTYSSDNDKSRFNVVVFVLTKIHELLSKNLVVTRRELFYQNVTRFRNQANLDVGVRDVCCLLEQPPWNLGITATAKGLVAGPLKIYHTDGNVTECNTSGGTLIPQDVNSIREVKSTAKYILVVEKDAVFQKLLDEGALVRLGPVIIMTGKGYPDVCTRQLLCRLVRELRLKALALVDADPHGYEIFLTYKYGSLAQSHLSSNLACTSFRLLGARPADVAALAAADARLALTPTDKRKISALIKRPYLNSSNGARIKEDLVEMLNNGVKAEIEAIAPTAAALCDSYLPSKLIRADFL